MNKDSRPRLDLMLDIETLGTDSNAIVIQVAAKSFKLFPDASDEDFKLNIHLSVFGNLLLGRMADYDTVQWWNNPERAKVLQSLIDADKTVSVDAREGLKDIYRQLTGICRKYQTYIWCRGYDFDLNILDHAMRDAVTSVDDKYRTPWDFWRKRCVRTILEVHGIVGNDVEKQDNPHDAMIDCMTQIDQVLGVKNLLYGLRQNVESRQEPTA